MRKFSFRKQFREAVDYIKESSGYIYFVIFIFFGFSLIGLFFWENFTFLDEFLKQILLQTEGLNWIEMIFFILQNNVQGAFFGILFGFIFGVFPLLNAMGNGIVLGYVASQVIQISGIGVMWRILPHGIFELPAIFIALGLGVKFGMFIFAKDGVKELKRRFYESMNAFLMIILPLLILAAIIEGILIVLF